MFRTARSKPAAFDLLIAACGAALLTRQFVHATTVPGIDFVHVWHATHQLLAQSGAYADPLFTYPPGSALLLAPLGALSYTSAQLLMLIANVIAVCWATWLMLVTLQRRPGRRTLAVALLALGVANAVASTWANDNLNGLLLLLEVAALRSMSRSRWYLAAGLIGLSLTVKPVLIALLLMFALRRQWRALGLAVAIPAAITGLGWWLVRDSSRYVHVVVPFLVHGAQLSYNDSFIGVGHLLSLPGALVVALRLMVVGVAAAWLTMRRHRADCSIGGLSYEAGILLTATFLAAPMSEAYYTLYLIPAIAAWASTNVRSAMVATLTVATCFATFELPGSASASAAISTPLAVRPTLGWLGCLAAFAVIGYRQHHRDPALATPASCHHAARERRLCP